MSGHSPEQIALIITAIAGACVTVIGAIVAGTVKIILILRGQNQQLNKIHVLVNGRALNTLRLLVTITKREVDRTNDPEDIRLYRDTLAELARAAAAAEDPAAGVAAGPKT